MAAVRLCAVLLLCAVAQSAAALVPQHKDRTFDTLLETQLNVSSRYISSGTAVVSNNGYLCFASSSSAYSNTVCSYYQIFRDSSYSCSGTGGFSYYCSTYYNSVSSGLTSDGNCYDTSYHAYLSTSCFRNQIMSDTYLTGACSGASYGAYMYYCPSSGSPYANSPPPGRSPPPSPPPPASSDNTPSSGVPAGAETCVRALVVQVLSQGGLFSNSGIKMSDDTCNTCGKSKFCPLDRGTYANLNSALFDCTSGGSTVYTASGTFQYCRIAPGAGLLCIVIIIPTVLLALCIAGCVICCRRRAAANTLIIQQPGIAMVAPSPLYQQPPQQQQQQQYYAPQEQYK